MSTTQQQETEVVSGQVASVITKGPDKWQVEVNTGGQYSRKLWTKDFGLVNQMQASIGQYFDFICNVSHWTGQNGPVRSLWVNGVAAPGSTPVQQQQVPGTGTVYNPTVPMGATGMPVPQVQQNPPFPVQQQAPQTSISQLEKEERIMREHAMNMAVLMLHQMKPEERTLQGLVGVAEGLIRYYKLGPAAVQNGQPEYAREPGPEQQQLPPQGEPTYENTPPPHTDDDIPF